MTSTQPAGGSASDEGGDRGPSDDSDVEQELKSTLPSATDGDLDELSKRGESEYRVVLPKGLPSQIVLGDACVALPPAAFAEGDSGELGDRVEGPPDA